MFLRKPYKTLSLMIATSTVMSLSAHAEIYRRIKPDGTVEYSDVQARDNEQPMDSEQTTPGMIVPPTKTLPERPTRAKKEKPSPAAVDLKVSITSPANDTAIRDNAGNLTVKLAVSPRLKDTHFLVLKSSAGGSEGPQKALEFFFTNLDRGTHTFTASIVNQAGKVITTSAPVSVHLLRNSILFPNQKRLRKENGIRNPQ